MDMRNCRRCGKLFVYTGMPICRDCIEQDEADFQTVKQYIYEHPLCSLAEVSSETDVAVKKITRFLKEGRLEIVKGSNIFIECESCGKQIKSGRFCKSCSDSLGSQMESAGKENEEGAIEKEKKEANKPRMYTADRY